jgi:hypothetical protein
MVRSKFLRLVIFSKRACLFAESPNVVTGFDRGRQTGINGGKRWLCNCPLLAAVAVNLNMSQATFTPWEGGQVGVSVCPSILDWDLAVFLVGINEGCLITHSRNWQALTHDNPTSCRVAGSPIAANLIS